MVPRQPMGLGDEPAKDRVTVRLINAGIAVLDLVDGISCDYDHSSDEAPFRCPQGCLEALDDLGVGLRTPETMGVHGGGYLTTPPEKASRGNPISASSTVPLSLAVRSQDAGIRRELKYLPSFGGVCGR